MTTETTTIAQTILDQLGGGRFVRMTGAKRLVALDRNDSRRGGLTFAVGRNDKRVTHVIVTLTHDDLYNVEYVWCRGTTRIVRATDEGIYHDMLVRSFERETGLVTSL